MCLVVATVFPRVITVLNLTWLTSSAKLADTSKQDNVFSIFLSRAIHVRGHQVQVAY